MTSVLAKVCENYYESRGCFKDANPKRRYSKRPLENFLFNEREPTYKNWNGQVINLKMWGKGYLSNLICKCSQAAKEAGYRFFGIQFWGKNFYPCHKAKLNISSTRFLWKKIGVNIINLS